MRRGRYAAGDGSLARSAGMQTARGAVLIGVAVLVGVILLNTAPNESTSISTVHHASTTTTKKPSSTIAPVTTAPAAAAARAPSLVAILVANGTQVPQAASRVNTQLIQAGYNSVGTDNARSNNNATTVIYFVPTYQPEAEALAAALSLPPTTAQALPSPPPVTNTKGANLVVVIGADLASQLSPGPTPSQPQVTQPPPPTSPRTTTTVRRTTTTVHPTTTTTIKH